MENLRDSAGQSGVAGLKHDSGLLGRGQDARSPLSMVNLPVSFFPSAIHAQDQQRRPIEPSHTGNIGRGQTV